MSAPHRNTRPGVRPTTDPARFAVRESVSGSIVKDLAQVMSELVEVIRAENAFLQSGMPSALSTFIARKEDLVARYVELHKLVLMTARDQLQENADLHAQLTASGLALRSVTEENMQRLNEAMIATRRRIDSVIAAVHEHDEQHSTYGKESLTIVAGYKPSDRLH